MAGMLRFHAVTRQAPKGSKRHVGGGRMVESSKYLPWFHNEIVYNAELAAEAAGWDTVMGPVVVRLEFEMQRPRSHEKLTSPPRYVTNRARGDIDKLQRAVLDALTEAAVWYDDSQVVEVHASKRYGPVDCTTVTVCPIPGA